MGDWYSLATTASLMAIVPLGCEVAFAQRASENAVQNAEDAFGGSVGLENVGIYSSTDVRGFNPQQAGNAQIDGIYFDQLSQLAARARQGSTIRVGFTALNSFAPSPTGIVSWRLHPSDDKFVATLGLIKGAYGGRFESVDMKVPIVEGHVSLATGLGHSTTRYGDGSQSQNYAWSLMPRFRFGGVEIKPFVSGYLTREADVRPIAISRGPFVPKVPAARKYLGQKWADAAHDNINNGVIVKAAITQGLSFRGGAFRSRLDRRKNFTEVYAIRDAAGTASHFLLADPKHDNYANSWEGLLSYRFTTGRINHTVTAGARGRFRHIENGGSDFFDFGETQYDERDPEAEPAYAFGDVNVGKLRQVAYAIGYLGKWEGVGQINLGLNKTDYDASFSDPGGTTRTSANPWLYNASLMLSPSSRVSLYAGIVTGLEDQGSAPESALNRNQQLPAVKTRQVDGGIRLKVARLDLVASLFQIEKPYFSFDADTIFTRLGNVRHRGAEFSLNGYLTNRLQLLAGVVVMDPVVTGPGVALGIVGRRPVGTPKIHGRVDLSYRADLFDGLTFTATVKHDSRRAASAQTYSELEGRQLFVPSRTTVDLGARHNFKINDVPVNLRFVVENVFDRKSWDILASNTFRAAERRSWSLHLLADF